MKDEIVKQIIKIAVPILMTALISLGGHIWKLGEVKAEAQHQLGTVIQHMATTEDCK